MRFLHKRVLEVVYFLLSAALPILLLYPALVYGDLSGMGGYDGFATPEMMITYGSWATIESRSLEYVVFEALNIIWLLSLVNIPIAVLLALKLFHKQHSS